MQFKIKGAAVALTAFLAAGCESSGKVIATGIRGAAPRYMVPPKPLPKTPEGIAMNGIGKIHLADVIGQCVSEQRKTRGLQRYARIVSSRGAD